jgi:hypothetical protein
MSHVVIQAAEFATVDQSKRCEAELRGLIDDCIRAERAGESSFDAQRVFSPLAAFGARHGVSWPRGEGAAFRLKDPMSDTQLLRVDRMVFLWAAGFELGGDTLRAVLTRLGATAAAGEGRCHLVISSNDPDQRVEELGDFLREEGMGEQFEIIRSAPRALGDAYFSVTMNGPEHSTRIVFDTSGVQDWAFTALLPQLSDENPALLRV